MTTRAPSNPRRALRRLRLLLTGVLLVQGIGGLLVIPLRNQEIFPLYGWQLFTLTPRMKPQYDLRIEASGERTFSPPVYYRTAPKGVKRGQAISAERVIQEWGRAVRAGDAATAAERRELVENHYLTTPARYALVEQTFDVIEFWKTRKPRSETVLAVHPPSNP